MQRGSTPSSRLRAAMSRMSEILGQEAINEEELMLTSFSEASISEYLKLLNDKYEGLKSQLTRELSELKRSQKTNDSLKSSIAEEIRKRETTTNQTRDVISKLKSENSHLLTEFSSLQSSLAEKEAALSEIESQILSEEEEIQRNLELESQVKRQESENTETESNLLASLNSKRANIEENVKKLEEMEIVRETLEKEIMPLKIEWGEIAKGLSLIDKKRRDLLEEESKYESNYERNITRSKEALNQHSILTKKLESLLSIESQLNEEISAKNEQLAIFRESNGKLEKRIASFGKAELEFNIQKEKATKLQVEKEIMQNVLSNFFKAKLEEEQGFSELENNSEENVGILEKEFRERKEVIISQKNSIEALTKELLHVREMTEAEKNQCKELTEIYSKNEKEFSEEMRREYSRGVQEEEDDLE